MRISNVGLWMAMVGLITGCAGAAWSAETANAKKPALFIQEQPDATFAKELEKAGFIWHFEPAHGANWNQWTRELIGQFNAIVLISYPQVGTAGPNAEQQKFIELLREYVEKGGGLFLCGGNNQDSGMCVRFQNELLKPYGAEVLREFICDKDNQFKGRFWTYTWTDQIEKNPVTEGVKGLIYPMMTGWGGTSFANPIKADNTWTVLVRGMPTAFTCALYDTKPMETKPASYNALPPLTAVKDVGKGRIVLWPTLGTTTFIDGYHYMWDDGLILSGKIGNHTSQGSQLVFNLLKYLVDPSMKSGAVGGYAQKPRERRDLTKEPGFSPFDWDTVTVSNTLPNVYKALIGVRTELSSGKGTVAEFAVEAKKHGYAMMAVTEDLEKMNAAKWQKLVDACKQASAPDCEVVPGLKFFDENENQGVVFGPIGWVKDEWMSTNSVGRIKEISFWTHGYDFWPPCAVITPKANPKRPWYLGTCKGYAAYTYDNGKLIDESVEEYLHMLRLRFDNFVVAVHLVNAPDQVASAAKEGNYQTYVRSDSPTNIVKWISNTHPLHGDDWFFPSFVSSGPKIDIFQALNFGTTDLSIPGNERVRLRLSVSSDSPLKEIKLMDGEKLFRRFAVKGETKFDQSFDVFHDRQRTFVAIITDEKGQQAVSWERWIEVQEQWFGNCMDNWNLMFGGKYQGTRFMTCRALESYICPASSDWAWPRIQAQKGDKTMDLMPGRPAVHIEEMMVSRFASIIDYNVENAYAPEASANWNDFCEQVGMKPLESVKTRVRRIFFTSRPDYPQVELLEGQITFKQPCKLAAGKPVTLMSVSSGQTQPYDQISYSDASGMMITERRPEVFKGEISRHGILAAGGYISVWPYVGGAVGAFALDSAIGYHAWFSGNSSSFRISCGEPNKDYQAGETLQYRLLSILDHKFPDELSNRNFEWIKTSFGLQGDPSYRVEPISGSIVSKLYTLRVKAEKGGFMGHFQKASLPMDIPVVVEGLNDRWQAGIWYKGKNPMLRPEWTMNDYDQLIAAMQEREIENAWYPGPVEGGIGYFGVDVEKSDRDVFVGNFLICDQPEVFLQILDSRAGKKKIEVHNPTEKDLACTVRPSKGFDMLGNFSKKVDVPAGQSVMVSIE